MECVTDENIQNAWNLLKIFGMHGIVFFNFENIEW